MLVDSNPDFIRGIKMCLRPIYVKTVPFPVACGKCIECKVKKSNEWAYRCMLEASLYKENCFLTLTYNEDNYPERGSLSRRDLQLFIKRLRFAIDKKYGLKIRYFGCGEYGSRKGRPHYHLIIFGWKPTDLTFLKRDKRGNLLYRSALVESCWTKGFSSVGEVTLETAKYTAVYMQKVFDQSLKKPFVCMSLKPGIGANAVFPNVLDSLKIYYRGKYIKLPRYYMKVLEDNYGLDLSEIRERGKEKAFLDYLQTDPSSRDNENKRRWKKFEKIFKKPLDKFGMP